MFMPALGIFGAVGTASYTANAVDFNGTTNYLSKASDFTGGADSKSGIFSCWARIDNLPDIEFLISNGSDSPDAQFYIRLTGSGVFQVVGKNSATDVILSLPTSSTYSAGATWYNILCSWNLATSATHMYINDSSNVGSVTATNDTIDYTRGSPSWGVGGGTSGNNKWDGCLSEIYFAPGQYLDLSNSANRAKFISGGKPVNLGTDGSTPTGTAPILYLKGNAAGIATNSGTGGNMTANGSFNNCSSSPSS